MIKKPTVELGEDQFFLPIGIEDEEGVLHRVVTLAPMDGEVEEAMGDSKHANNSGKILTAMLFGIIEEIEGVKKVNKEMVRNLTVADRDYLMAMNFITSFGDDLEFIHKCPECKTENVINVKVPNLKVTYLEDSESRTLKLKLPHGVKNASGDKFNNVEVRFTTGADLEAIAPLVKANPGQANTTLLTRVTLSITNDGGGELSPINFDTFKKMSKKDRDFINRELKKATPGVDFDIITPCAGCGDNMTARIPATSFLAE